MKAIVGLGNPGMEYEDTRHNIGFAVINNLNTLCQNRGENFKVNKRLYAEIVSFKQLNDQVILAKPTTYMNDSGKAVLAIKNFYKLSLNDFLIVHDDVSLPLGKIRLQKTGGAGGQHGVESIIECSGGEKGINRLKIGIGPDPGGHKRADYVLQKFKTSEKQALEIAITTAVRAVFSWLNSGIEKAMNEFNGLDLLP